MPRTNFKELLDAGVHFGHLKRKWNPNMAPYIFMERNGIHIIDLEKTVVKIEEAASALKQIAKSGRKILFVATKKQAREIIAERIKKTGMPYVTERWPGGMLTNFPTIRKAVKKMSAIDKKTADGAYESLSKRERLQIKRQRAKLEKQLGSISDLTRLPAVLFIVDISKEHIAVREAMRLTIPVIAMVDTNSDPSNIDFPIPANDDASKSISLIIDIMANAIEEGLSERKMEKEKEVGAKKNDIAEKQEKQETKTKKIQAKKPKPETFGKDLPKTGDVKQETEDKKEETGADSK
ncbi:MAG: 30S ribosomal protein S2 [Bacteroidetes bacterium]|nr:30S ribosomal protein S2 [Bacteroidota bacterium]